MKHLLYVSLAVQPPAQPPAQTNARPWMGPRMGPNPRHGPTLGRPDRPQPWGVGQQGQARTRSKEKQRIG